jgi:hypothetical protein
LEIRLVGNRRLASVALLAFALVGGSKTPRERMRRDQLP